MKKIENNFTVTGFIGNDAEIRQFADTSVARFPLAIGRQEKHGDETVRVSAFTGIEVWRKNEAASSFEVLKKGAMITVEGYFRPEQWTDKDGVSHSRLTMVANKFYETPDKEEKSDEAPKAEEPAPKKEKKTSKKSK